MTKNQRLITKQKIIFSPFNFNNKNMTFRFFIYGLLGWCLEVFWTGLGSLLAGNPELRGRSSLWMFPIYGLAVLLEPLYQTIKNKPVFIRGGIYTLVIFIIEYLSGWMLESTIGTYPWDYTHSPYSINGFIRLDYAPVWFIVGLLFEKVYLALINSRITFE